MEKKPLTLIRPGDDVAASVPAGLGETGLNVWRSVQAQYRIDDAGGVAMLETACRALDRAQDCAAQIQHDGPVLFTKQGPRDHPLLRHEVANRALALRALSKLGLDVEPVRPTGRPGRGFGWRPDF